VFAVNRGRNVAGDNRSGATGAKFWWRASARPMHCGPRSPRA